MDSSWFRLLMCLALVAVLVRVFLSVPTKSALPPDTAVGLGLVFVPVALPCWLGVTRVTWAFGKAFLAGRAVTWLSWRVFAFFVRAVVALVDFLVVVLARSLSLC